LGGEKKKREGPTGPVLSKPNILLLRLSEGGKKKRSRERDDKKEKEEKKKKRDGPQNART